MFGTGIVVRLRRLLGVPARAPSAATPLPPPDLAIEPVVPVCHLDPGAIFSAFPPVPSEPERGFLKDALGGRMRTSFLKHHDHLDGVVAGHPEGGKEVLHDVYEWMGTLLTVREAAPRGSLTVIELGAGWAPWLVSSALAARQLGIPVVRLLGLEASPAHHAMMAVHFADNGLDPSSHQLLLGAAGAEDGTARFPRLDDPAADWGASVLENGLDKRGWRFAAADEVPMFAVSGLVERFDRVDLLHVDIQGAEESALPAAMAALSARVRRVVIGTHGTAIDHALDAAFGGAGWALEVRQPSRFAPEGHLVLDGTQVWRNDRLA